MALFNGHIDCDCCIHNEDELKAWMGKNKENRYKFDIPVNVLDMLNRGQMLEIKHINIKIPVSLQHILNQR